MSRLLPYETILKAREGDPEAVNAVLLLRKKRSVGAIMRMPLP